MELLLENTNCSNMLPQVTKGKCDGCHDTAKDIDVLSCYLCKKRFHAVGCTVVDTLSSDALPSNTNVNNFAKFSPKRYSTGSFIWTCFRCGSLKQLSSDGNISERVSILESLLVTLTPAITSLSKALDETNVNTLISAIRASSNSKTVITTASAPSAPLSAAANVDGSSVDTNPVQPGHVAADQPPVQVSDSSQVEVPITVPEPVPEPVLVTVPEHAPATATPDLQEVSKPSKFRVSVNRIDDASPPLRSLLHKGLSEGLLSSYNDIRFFSSHRADLYFDNFTDADHASRCVADVLTGYDVGRPVCTSTKAVYIVGLSEYDTKKSVFEAVSHQGRNPAINGLVNPSSFHVHEVRPCNNNASGFRATVFISSEIFDAIMNKMNRKIKIGYLSCYVFPRRDSLRCNHCQRLGHRASNCESDAACVNCGECHDSKGCTAAPKCVNCHLDNKDSNHRADYANCPSYIEYKQSAAKK